MGASNMGSALDGCLLPALGLVVILIVGFVILIYEVVGIFNG